jgi:hypothetical protein
VNESIVCALSLLLFSSVRVMQLHLNSKTNGDRVRLPTLTTINTFNNSESHKTKNASKSIYGMFGFGSTTKKDKMSNETTSLLPSSASGNTSSYYFLPKTEAEGGVHTSVRDADVTESVPAGSTEAEFAPRQVGLKVRFHDSFSFSWSKMVPHFGNRNLLGDLDPL